MSKQAVLKPRLSEKSLTVSQTGVYVFEVELDANKHTVARAVEAQFDVSVSEVNISISKGKNKRVVTKRGGRVGSAKRRDIKKAYVKLVAGQTLPIFEAEEEAEAKQVETQAKIDKVAAKAAEKEAKKEAKAAKKEAK